MSVELNKDLLVDLGGWSVLKVAKGLHKGSCVKEYIWEKKILKGIVQVGGKSYYPRLNLRSPVFAENQCNCFEGQKGEICSHAIAMCLEAMAPMKEAQPPLAKGGNVVKPILKSLTLSNEKGIPLQFRILLPPNLKKTALKDRIMVKIEVEDVTGNRYAPENINRGKVYQIELPHIVVASHIERWCEGKLFGLLQLSRHQLTQLLKPLKEQPAVFWVNDLGRPIEWAGGMLAGVHCYLEMPEEIISESTKQANCKKKAEQNPKTRSPKSLSVKVDGSPFFLAIELPSREAIVYQSLLDLVKLYGFKLEVSNRRWWLRDRHKTLNFLAEHYHSLQKNHSARFSENFLNSKYLFFLSARILISSIFLFSPLIISATSPLTGEVYIISSRSLSYINGVPATTSSPGFTNNFGRVIPMKSLSLIHI